MNLFKFVDYYYNIEIKDILKKLKEYFSNNLNLNNIKIIAIISLKLTRKERNII